jgi:hypothetical protein
LLAILTTLTAGGAERLGFADLLVGTPLGDLPPASAFTAYACGSNGGPPMQPLSSFAEFGECTPEADGLREVRFAYEDRAEQAARRAGKVAAAWGLGTSYDYFPIIPSALFDAGGTLRGLRIVTDPLPELRKDPFLRFRPRWEHYLLQLYLMDAFGMSGTDCKDLPLPEGATPVLGMAVNRVCTRTDPAAGLSYRIEARFYRRRGEADVDRFSGGLTEGQFLSETRAEIRASGG